MAATKKNIRSMLRSTHFRKAKSLPPIKRGFPKKKNRTLVRKLLDRYDLPDEDPKTKLDE